MEVEVEVEVVEVEVHLRLKKRRTFTATTAISTLGLRLLPALFEPGPEWGAVPNGQDGRAGGHRRRVHLAVPPKLGGGLRARPLENGVFAQRK